MADLDLSPLFWGLYFLFVLGLVAFIAYRRRRATTDPQNPPALTAAEVVPAALLCLFPVACALFIDNSIGFNHAPFGRAAAARQAVNRLGGEFAEIYHGNAYEIRLSGAAITDESLRRLHSYIYNYHIDLTLERTSVTCDGAKTFHGSMPHWCTVVTDIDGCPMIGPEKGLVGPAPVTIGPSRNP